MAHMKGKRRIQLSSGGLRPLAVTAMLHPWEAGGSAMGLISTLTGACKRSCFNVPSDRRNPKGIGLLKAKVTNIFKRGCSEMFGPRPHAGGLPQELLETIIAHVQFDTQTLKACSGTCHSWYITTLPYLHHTLTLRRKVCDPARGGLIPLQKLDEMQLLPFVKQLRIMHYYADTSPALEIFNAKGLAYFSALTNVQELGLERLDLRLFIPGTRPYLGPFMPRLRFLVLVEPKGHHHLLLYFLGLFPNLEDLKLVSKSSWRLPQGPVPVPQSAPLLRGQLMLIWFREEDFLRDLSELCGGLRFRCMDLLGEEGSRFLLDICAGTLETLRIHPTRWIGRGDNLDDYHLSDPPTYRSSRITTTDV